jgi:hypothetical protein
MDSTCGKTAAASGGTSPELLGIERPATVFDMVWPWS